MLVARHYLITGRVQGVGYRMFAADAAAREGLGGHISNLADGRVEVVAEGDADALGRFEAALWRGPSRSRVTDIAITETTPAAHAARFTIR